MRILLIASIAVLVSACAKPPRADTRCSDVSGTWHDSELGLESFKINDSCDVESSRSKIRYSITNKTNDGIFLIVSHSDSSQGTLASGPYDCDVTTINSFGDQRIDCTPGLFFYIKRSLKSE